MGYISIGEVYRKNIENNEKLQYIDRINNPIYKNALERIKYQATTIAKESGLYYITKKSFKLAKQEFFMSSLNELHRYNFYRTKSLVHYGVGCISICMSLLSDHKILIQQIANAGKDQDIPQHNKGSLNLMLQCAMRNDVVALKAAIGVYKKYAIKKEWNQLQVDFYEAYLDRNEGRIKEVLTILETPKLRKQDIFHGEFIDTYLSVLTTAYLKLCWKKGMQIHIDSPTVPMGLMPIEPLDAYKIEYPYLEGWEDGSSSPPQQKEEKIYEEVGPYPKANPTLRNKFVHEDTIKKAVNHFCPKHNNDEKTQLVSLIWDAYTDPQQFDFNHKEYVRKNASWPLNNAKGEQVLEARPFWSELTEYDDVGFFKYCTSFIIMNEMNIEIDEVYAYLETMKQDLGKDGGFFKKLFG